MNRKSIDEKTIMASLPKIAVRPETEEVPTILGPETLVVAVPMKPAWLASRAARAVETTKQQRPPPLISRADKMGVLAESRSTATVAEGAHPPWAMHLWHWPTRAALYGASTSLAIHLTLLVLLAMFAISGKPVAILSTVEVEFGNPGGDTIFDSNLEASLEMEGGHEAAPLQLPDLDPSFSQDAFSVNAGETLDGIVNGTGLGDGRGFGEGTGRGSDTGTGLPAINVPSFAVSKGSFSAWTEPRDPDPGQQYVIVIQVRLPKTLREYRASDLTGMVIGTDLYKQVIKFKSTEKFPVNEGAVEVRVSVPGAAKLVRDTIRIESRLLREKQILKIEF